MAAADPAHFHDEAGPAFDPGNAGGEDPGLGARDALIDVSHGGLRRGWGGLRWCQIYRTISGVKIP